MLKSEDEAILEDFLGMVYGRVFWGKMRTSKNPHDIFNHRVRSAARRPTIYAFASKLCNYFGLQTLPVEAQELLDKLRPIESEVLNTLSREHIPICVRAIIRSHQMKKEGVKRVKTKWEERR